MTREAWEQSISSTLCPRIDSLSTGYFRVSITEYLDNETWRSWAGYAQDIITRTKPYIEKNSEILALCENPEYPFPNRPFFYFGANIADFIDADSVLRIDVGAPDRGIVVLYDDERHVIYEWRLDEEPRIQILKRPQD